MTTETGNEASTNAATQRCPLHASVASVNAILNDGISPNSVTLRIINALDTALILGPDAELILSFDMGPTTVAHALATEGQVQGFEVAVDDVSHFRVIPKPTFNSPTSWLIQPAADAVVLPPHGGIELTISSIVTDHPPGGTNAYLNYRNVQGQEGQLILTLEKVRLESDGGGRDDGAMAAERFLYDAAYLLEIDQGALAALRKARAAAAFEAAEAKRQADASKAAEAEKQAALIKAVAGDDTSEIVHAMQFDGASSIDLGAGIQLGAPFTIEVWIKVSRLDLWQAIVGMRSPGTGRNDVTPFMTMDYAGIYWGFKPNWNDETCVTQTNVLESDKWMHVACTFDGEQAILFVNGVEKNKNTVGPIPNNALPINLIGAHFRGASFAGTMAELRVWKVVRLAEEIQAGMKQRLLGNEEGLLAYWPLNQVENGKVKDFSAGGVLGTIQGNPTLVRESTKDLSLSTLPPPQITVPSPLAPVVDDLAKTGPLDLFDAPPLDEPGFLVPAVGVLVRSEQCWYSQGVRPGQLLYSTGLSPGESTSITVTHAAVEQDAVAEISATVADETRAHAPAGSRPFEAIGALPTPMAAPTGGGRGLADRTNREIATRIQQQASRARKQLPAVSEASGQGAGQRVVTNRNPSRALSALYYAAVHHYRVVTRATEYQRVLFLPMKALDPNDARVQAVYQLGLWDLRQRQRWASDPSAARQATDSSQSATVPTQLSSDPLFVSQVVWTNTPAADWRRRLRGFTYQGQVIDDMIDPTPVAIIGNYVGFHWRFDDDLDKLDWLLTTQLLDKDFRAWLQDHGYNDTDADLSRASSALKRDYLDQGMSQGDEGRSETVVPVPTGGVLADGMLGPSTCAQTPDTSPSAKRDDEKTPA